MNTNTADNNMGNHKDNTETIRPPYLIWLFDCWEIIALYNIVKI